MKKLALLAAILLLFGLTAGFADGGADISGEASATFGYNLEVGSAGFENDSSVDVILTFLEEQTIDSGMMSGWHGWIEFADFSVIYDQDGVMRYQDDWVIYEDADGDQSFLDPSSPAGDDNSADYADSSVIWVEEPTVMAKITNGMIFIQVYDKPGFTGVDLVAPIEDDTDFSDYDDASWAAEDEEAENDVDVGLGETGGITIGYDSDMFDVEVYVADYDGYGEAGDEADDWVIGGKVSVAAAGAEITAEVNKAISGTVGTDDNALAVGAKAAYTLDAGMMTVAPYVAIDAYDDDVTADFQYEFGGGVDLTFTNDNSAGAHVFYSGQSVAGAAASGDDMVKGLDIEVSFTEDGEAGFVPGLGVAIMFGYYDVGTDVVGDEADMLVEVDIDYMFGDFQPYVKFDLDQANGTAMYKADVGINWTGIPNTTITVEWDSGDLNASPDPLLGAIELVAKVEM
jgi:hypothetical protein